MSDWDITREDRELSGRYVLRHPDGMGELTFRHIRPGVISADHTHVDPAIRNRGAARALVDRLVSDARAEGTKIRPVCSYVVAVFRRNPELDDLVAD